ncbi:MAG TPA: CoA pyrophosphatase [Victivallales bacterium]|nr:CoA pyrophosphatase [Victivallales bacterium]
MKNLNLKIDNDSILNLDSFVHASVLIPVFYDKNGAAQFIFQERAAHIRQGREVCFPGGVVDEQDKNTKATAIRETVEELGVQPDKIRITGKLGKLFAPMTVLIETYLGIIDIDDIDELDYSRDEVAKVFSIPVDLLASMKPEKYTVISRVHPTYRDENNNVVVLFPAKNLGLPERYWRSWGGREHEILLYNTDHGKIWGLTAQLVCRYLENCYRK